MILKEQLNDHYNQMRKDRKLESSCRSELQAMFDPQTWTILWTWILVCEKQVFINLRNKHVNKFEKIISETKRTSQTKNSKPAKPVELDNKMVINISSKNFETSDLELLRKGLDFVPVVNSKVTPEIVANTETTAKRIGDKGQVLVHVTKAYYNSSKNSEEDNLSKEERHFMNSLRKDDSLIVTNSDKGNAVVVMDDAEYNEKMLNCLNSGSYKLLTVDPTEAHEKALKKKLDSLKEAGWVNNKWVKDILSNQSRFPTIYGNPKIHKPEIPLRPVVSTIGTPWSLLAKYLVEIVNPIAYPEGNISLKNSLQFVSLMRNTALKPDALLVSLDVVNLFGSVPTDKCLKVLQEKLNEDFSLQLRTLLPISTIMELVTVCVKTTYFKYRDQFYEQTAGLAMGSPLSPALANVYTNYLEDKMRDLQLFQYVDLLSKYVDDYFLIWLSCVKNFELFLSQLNELDDDIKFTHELEVNNSLPFLDIRVTKNRTKLNTVMYEKECSSGLVLNFNSNHPNYVKRNIAKNLSNKIVQCSDNSVNDLKILEHKLEANDYPKAIIANRVSQKEKRAEPDEMGNSVKYLSVPFNNKNKAFEYRRKCATLGVKVAFKRNRNVGEIIGKKGKTDGRRNTNVIYKINCQCGDFYVGETGRDVLTRISEHKRATVKKNLNNAIAKHVSLTNHVVDFDNFEILDRETNVNKRRIREAYFIKKLGAKINANNGVEICDFWN